MNKLISANFSRLFKNNAFCLYMIFSGGLSMFTIFIRYTEYHEDIERYNKLDPICHTIDSVVFMGLIFMLFAVPVFVANFVCTEYTDGTIRNKLIVGHKRSSIYLANLIVCTTGTLIGVALNLLITLTLGTALCGLATPVSEILKQILFSVIAFISLTAVMVMIAMLVNSKAGASVSTLILTFIMFYVTMAISDMLYSPEHYDITKTKRKVYQTIYDAMPVAHIYESATFSTENAVKRAGYDGAIIVVTTALGIILFRKKDLK